MAALTDQLVTGIGMICSCDFTPDHITNGRWDCDSNDLSMVIFRADVVGTGTSKSTADDFNGWADTASNIDVNGESLHVAGVETCASHDCSDVGFALPGHYYYWIIGLITGVIIIIIIVVITVTVLWWKHTKKGQSDR